jgi:hypothetical protein
VAALSLSQPGHPFVAEACLNLRTRLATTAAGQVHRPSDSPACTLAVSRAKPKRPDPGPCPRHVNASSSLPGSSSSSTGVLPSASSLVICREHSSTVPACWARAREKTIHRSDREPIRCSWQLISGIAIAEIATATSTTSTASQPSDGTNTDGVFLAAAHVSTSAHPLERATFHESSHTIMNTRDQLETASCLIA